MLMDDLKKFDICPDAALWLANQDDPQRAWDTCPNGGWMVLWLGRNDAHRVQELGVFPVCHTILTACYKHLGYSADLIVALRKAKTIFEVRPVINEAKKWYKSVAKSGGTKTECYLAYATMKLAEGQYAKFQRQKNWRSREILNRMIYSPYEAVKYAGKSVGEDQQAEFAHFIRNHIPKIA